MEIKRLVVGWGQANCYLVYRQGHDEALIIDPGGDGARISAYLEELGLRGAAILCTHGHADHIGALSDLHHQGECVIFTPMTLIVDNAAKNLSQMFAAYDPITEPAADRLLVPGGDECPDYP